MQIEFFNSPKPEEFDPSILPVEDPAFLSYVPDWGLIQTTAVKYEKYQNILIIGHGGNITSFYGFYSALREQTNKHAYFLSTVDPDYIFSLKQQLLKENTLVIAISKSGETVTQIEALMQFIEYPLLFVCGKNTPLHAIAQKLKGEVVFHPSIGGRYTGLTEVALLPAAICGLGVQKIYEGAKNIFQNYKSDNLAWKAASVLWQLEQKGYVDVFIPIYSQYLFPMSALIVQLCHESFGKAGLGQTYFAHPAPESQHHTNQRFFGGRKNIVGFFLSYDGPMHSIINTIPTELHSIQIKNQPLFTLNKISLEDSLRFEMEGTIEDAKINGIPLAHLSIVSRTPYAIGEFTAFWQLYAIYASLLRGVNPFDQPEVEASKEISFSKRLGQKGLL